MSPHIHDLMSAIGWTLVHFLWQGALIGFATAIALTALRNARPQLRYLVACTGMLACLAWPAAGLLEGLLASDDALAPGLTTARAVITGAANAAPGIVNWVQEHMQLLVGAWASCALALALRMVAGLLWLERAGRSTAGNAHWQGRLDQLAECAGISRQVRLHIVERLASPVTAGWWRPVVLVPAALVSGMPADLLEALLAHELAHIKRHDYLVNLAQNVVEALLFYHPAVWWISGRIRAEREQIADDLAAGQIGESKRLARALSELEKLQFAAPRLAQAADGDDLIARIRRLVRPDRQTLSWKAGLPVLGLAVACLSACSGMDNRVAAAPLAPQPSMAAPADARPAPDRAPHRSRDFSNAVVTFQSCDRPRYPAQELAAHHQGAVTLGFLVDTDGKVRDSRVTQSSGYPALDEAARSALMKCQFRPASMKGTAVESWSPIKYIWTLD